MRSQDLIRRLKAAAPAVNSVPSDSEYAQLVADAVGQLGADAPVIRSADIAVVAGTATYALPTDCGSVIELVPMPTMGGVAISTMLIPLPVGFDESYLVEGATLRIVPTPAYTATRRLRYSAVHVLDSGNDYPMLTEAMARVALLYGQYLVLARQAAAAAAAGGWKYQIGDESVDKTQAGSGVQKLAEARLEAYQRAVGQLAGGYGSMARYVGEDAALY